jgi:glycosyltransferase involved in cell wall biosynthesis
MAQGTRGGRGPLVSVVMSTYDGAQFLPAQLDSILEQSHRHLEVIVRDDASRDATPALLREYAARDPRLRLELGRANLGLAAGLEWLLGRAGGEFVAIADQDDVWHPEKIATLLAHIGANQAVYSASRLIDAAGADLGCTLLEAFRVRPVSGSDPLALFWGNTVSGHALLFRRELVDRVLPFHRLIVYDHQIGIESLVSGGLAYCDAPLVFHRIHDRNHTNRTVLRTARRVREPDLARHFAGKIRRRRATRRRLLERLRFYTDRSLLPIDAEAMRRAEQSARAFRRSFFNAPLFWILLGEPRLLEGRRHRAVRAFRYAKGAGFLKLAYRRQRRRVRVQSPADRLAPADLVTRPRRRGRAPG